jgi:hypothetical protein
MFGRRSAFGLVTAGGLLIAACGDGDTATPPASDGDTPSVTPTEAGAAPTPRPTVDPEELRLQAQQRAIELTQEFIAREYPDNNYNVATVELHEIIPVLPRDAIPAIDEPNFDSVEAANEWLNPQEPVVALQLNGDVRAYPLQILTWHEMVNDIVGGEPVIVTYCPLCNTAITFRRTVDGEVRDFGVSGALRRNDLIMYDRQTQTLWQQITGEAIVGYAASAQLEFLSSQIVAWSDFAASFPNGQVLNRETGNSRNYGANPYPFYDASGTATIFPIDEFDDERLDAKERVLAVDLGDDPIAFPFSALSKTVVLTGESAGQNVVAFWQPGALSVLDTSFIIAGRNIGAAGAFLPVIDGESVTFEPRDGMIVDTGTGSTWNVLGQAIDGPLDGTELEPVVAANHFWFAWSVFKPDTRVISG